MRQEHASREQDDLISTVRILWSRKNLILSGTGAFTIAALIMCLILPNVYQAKVFLRAAISTADYNKQSPFILDDQHFLDFIDQDKNLMESEKDSLHKRVNSHQYLPDTISQAYDTGNPLPNMPPPVNITGFWITGQAHTKDSARNVAMAVADYVKDCLLYNALSAYIGSNYLQAADTFRGEENSILENDFKIHTLSISMSDSAAVHYAAYANEFSGAMPKSFKLFNLHGELADEKNNRLVLGREQSIDVVRLEFFTKANYLLKQDKMSFGLPLFEQIRALKDDYFKNPDHANDAIKTVYNTISSNLDDLDAIYAGNLSPAAVQTIGGLGSSAVKVRPTRSRIVLLTFLGSLLGFAALTLLLSWWEEVKTDIVGKE